ncbi:hypothetical protein ILUMI_17941, partial [Ignelater luminosus]
MSQYLPTGNFRFLSAEEIQYFTINSKENEDDTGYLLELDLEYPKGVYDLHADLPLYLVSQVIPDLAIDDSAAKKIKVVEDEEPQLIHESHYWLNKSKAKYAAVGYSPREGMMPIVKIGGILEYFAQDEDEPAKLFEGIEIQFISFKSSPLVKISKGPDAILLAKQSLDKSNNFSTYYTTAILTALQLPGE